MCIAGTGHGEYDARQVRPEPSAGLVLMASWTGNYIKGLGGWYYPYWDCAPRCPIESDPPACVTRGGWAWWRAGKWLPWSLLSSVRIGEWAQAPPLGGGVGVGRTRHQCVRLGVVGGRRDWQRWGFAGAPRGVAGTTLLRRGLFPTTAPQPPPKEKDAVGGWSRARGWK